MITAPRKGDGIYGNQYRGQLEIKSVKRTIELPPDKKDAHDPQSMSIIKKCGDILLFKHG